MRIAMQFNQAVCGMERTAREKGRAGTKVLKEGVCAQTCSK